MNKFVLSKGKSWNEIKIIPIIDVASSLGLRVKKMQSMCFKGHDHKTPSLVFYPKTNTAHCFGCGFHGNNIELVKEALGLDFKQAVLWFENNFNTHLNRTSSTIRGRENIQYKPSIKTSLSVDEYKSNPDIYEWFLDLCPLEKEGEKYLLSRGFSVKTIKHFGIKELKLPRLEQKKLVDKWGVESLLRCGLFKSEESIQNRERMAKLVWWDHVILFPFIEHGRVVYIQGRRLADDSGSYPKYINLKGVHKPLFNRDILDSLNYGSQLYICEGIPDAISAYEMNKNAVGILGATSFKKEWAQLMMNFNISIIPDSDKSGQDFAEFVQAVFSKIGKIVQIEFLPFGKDLNEYFQSCRNGVNS